MESYVRLIDQIDAFIRKYYKNRMIKGLIWFTGIFLGSLLLVALLEFFGRFNSVVRGGMFFLFIGANLFVFIQFILAPLLKLNALGKRIDRYQASEIIGVYFPEVADRLLNTLQLNDALSDQSVNLELIKASIAQRSTELTRVSFGDAIDLGENKKYLKCVLPILFVFFGISVFAPNWISDGSKRVVNYSTVYVPESPFSFHVSGLNKLFVEGDNIPVLVELRGEDFPNRIFLHGVYGKVLLTQVSKNQFQGEIPKVSSSGKFFLEGNEFTSKEFSYQVVGKPTVGKFDVALTYPAYLGRQNEVISNVNDLVVPEGTQVHWSVATKHVSSLVWRLDNKVQIFKKSGFSFDAILKDDVRGSMILVGNNQDFSDSISFAINVLKDAYPTVVVKEEQDTTVRSRRYFSGVCRDDYGLTRLEFVYQITSDDGTKREERMEVKSVKGLEIPFDFGIDFKREKLSLSDKISYYFVVTDNDGVNGNKRSRSQTFEYQLPSLSELNEQRDASQEAAKDALEDLLKRSEDCQKEVKKLRKDLLNERGSEWNKKNKLNHVKEEQESLVKDIENTLNQLNESLEQKEQLQEVDEELLQKQELLEDLLNEVMDEELMKLLDELERLMEESRTPEMQKKLDELEFNADDMNKQLDRSLELLKRMQVDEKIDGLEKELMELAKEQRELKNEIDSKKTSNEEGAEQQEELNKRFDELKEDLKELNKLNDELSKPMQLPDDSDREDRIDQQMEDAKDLLEKEKGKKAGEQQEGAADEMEQMANNLDMAQQDSNEEQQGEDMEMLRAILASLVSLSLDQEYVMNELSATAISNPRFKSLGREQRRIADQTVPVKDSLLELAKRQPAIGKFIDEELQKIKVNHNLSMDDIDERRSRELNLHQQLAMTSYNNLALMLNESLQEMQKQMQSPMGGSGSCSKPGGKGKPSPGATPNAGNLKEMLKKQLEQMEKGSNPNGQKPGEAPGQKPGEGGGMFGMGNKEIAKMAAEQSAIRRKLEELRRELNKDGSGSGNQLNPLIKELEKQEEDLVNKRFSKEMIKRQRDILTRLLESEKALMERGFEEQRESRTGKNENSGNLIRFDEYNKQKLLQIELLRSIDPVYNKYYKDKATQFFNGQQ